MRRAASPPVDGREAALLISWPAAFRPMPCPAGISGGHSCATFARALPMASRWCPEQRTCPRRRLRITRAAHGIRAHRRTPRPISDAAREASHRRSRLRHRMFTDHMVTIDMDRGRGGWHHATVGPRQPIALDPAAAVLHYAQEIFEGHEGLSPRRRHARAVPARSECQRLQPIGGAAWRCPTCPKSCSSKSMRQLLAVDSDWIPSVEGALALSAALHVRDRSLPRRAAGEAIQVHRHRQAGGQLLQVGRARR